MSVVSFPIHDGMMAHVLFMDSGPTSFAIDYDSKVDHSRYRSRFCDIMWTHDYDGYQYLWRQALEFVDARRVR